MQKIQTVFHLISAMFLWSGEAISQENPINTGQDLAKYLSIARDQADKKPKILDIPDLIWSSHAIGYARGLVESQQAAVVTNNSTLYCIPPETTPYQYIAAYVDWASRNPQYLHMPAFTAFMLAMSERFPCNK